MNKKLYFKITNAEENHNGFQYVNGLNVLDKPFEEKGSCVEGGLYFSDAEHILEFLSFGVYLREITFPGTDPDFKMVKDGHKWRANKIILGKKYDLMEISTFEYLISLGANVKINDNGPIRWACEVDNLELVKFLMDKGVDHTSHHNYPLQTASKYGNLEIVKFLIEKGADCKNNDGLAIRWACEYGHLEVVKFLNGLGADLTIRSNYGLRYACATGHLEIVKFLIEKGTDVKSCGNEAIKNACQFNHLEIVKLLIEHGADFYDNNNCAFDVACARGHLEIVKYLIEKNDGRIDLHDSIKMALNCRQQKIAVFLTEKYNSLKN